MREVKLYVLRGFSFGAGVALFVGLTALLAQSMSTFSAGDLISASQLNANFTTLDTKIDTQVAIAAPQGAVMAFYLSACPTGWVAADGSSSTPDLRGNFVRGRDDMGNGAAGADPDGVRGLGAFQIDAFQGHRHARLPSGYPFETVWWESPGIHNPASGPWNISRGPTDTGGPTTDHVNGAPRVTSETRPRNVALIYCMRQG